jgi:hypothetical protein
MYCQLLWSPCDLFALLCDAYQVHGLVKSKPVQKTCAPKRRPHAKQMNEL